MLLNFFKKFYLHSEKVFLFTNHMMPFGYGYGYGPDLFTTEHCFSPDRLFSCTIHAAQAHTVSKGVSRFGAIVYIGVLVACYRHKLDLWF